MSFLVRQRDPYPTVAEALGSRARAGRAGRHLERKEALRASVVWACLRLRADLLSTMPVDVYRRVQGSQFPVATPPIFRTPGGEQVLWDEWAYSSEFDLDSVGNAFGLITARDGAGKPARIDLVPVDECTLRSRGGKVTLRVNSEPYDYETEVWHEKQFTVSGVPVGLSPIAHAALTVNNHLSAQQFARDWFDNSATPSSVFKNTKKTLTDGQKRRIRADFKQTLRDGEPLVTGADWDFQMIGAKAAEAGFLSQQDASNHDVCRYLGVPGDMVDVNASTGSITYANITQRNLQFLILNLGPAIARREHTWSHRLLAEPRYVKLNTNALLRMDLKSRYDAYKVGVDGRWLPPSRILAREDELPLTPEEEAEFKRLFSTKQDTPNPLGRSLEEEADELRHQIEGIPT